MYKKINSNDCLSPYQADLQHTSPTPVRRGAKDQPNALKQINIHTEVVILPMYVYAGFVPNTHDHSRHHHSIHHLHPPIQKIHQ